MTIKKFQVSKENVKKMLLTENVTLYPLCFV